MLKYMQTGRNLAERGSNWKGYDESFRAMRGMEGWAWDNVNYAMWVKAAQQPRAATMGVSPFLDRGAGNRGAGVCFTYNRSQCNHNPTAEGVGVSISCLDAKICKYTSQQPLPSTCLDNDHDFV